MSDGGYVIPSEQIAAATPAFVPAMRTSPPAESATPRRGLAPAAVAAVVCGTLGLLVAPVLLGPAAIAGGFAGEHAGRGGRRTATAIAVLVAVAGGLAAVLALR